MRRTVEPCAAVMLREHTMLLKSVETTCLSMFTRVYRGLCLLLWACSCFVAETLPTCLYVWQDRLYDFLQVN
jgi:hypothetical protein